MNLKVSTSTPKVTKRLDTIGRNAVHAKPALRKIASLVADASSKSWGKGWKRNAPATLEAKARRGQGSTPLTATGETKAQLTNAARMTRRLTDSQLDLGATTVGAHFAKTGTKNAPKRNPLRYGKRVRQDSAQVVADHTVKR